ncbi:MAG: nitroreductase family protein, partial [Acidimicrobiales bacterium]
MAPRSTSRQCTRSAPNRSNGSRRAPRSTSSARRSPPPADCYIWGQTPDVTVTVRGMEIREAIRTNGTVRDFTQEPVDDATIASILDDARFAPSGGNRQPWRVAVVKDSTLRRELATLMQPVWDEYLETSMVGGTPFNVVDYVKPHDVTPNKANALLEHIDTIPVVLAVAANLANVAMMDAELDRKPVTGGASIYPFCWNLMLSA